MKNALGNTARHRLKIAAISALTIPALIAVTPIPADAAERETSAGKQMNQRAIPAAQKPDRRNPAARRTTSSHTQFPATSRDRRPNQPRRAASPYIHIEDIKGEAQARSQRPERAPQTARPARKFIKFGEIENRAQEHGRRHAAASDDGLADIVTGAGPGSPKAEGGFRQEPGTTVPTADDVLAPEREGEKGLLLPAVQQIRERASDKGSKGHVETTWKVEKGEAAAAGGSGGHVRVIEGSQPPARAKMAQNGTTVETASDVLAPESEEGFVHVDPKTGDAKRMPRPNAKGRMSQNGTTVETASQLQAPKGN